MDKRAEGKNHSDSVEASLRFLSEGLDLGSLKYTRRDELHERRKSRTKESSKTRYKITGDHPQ
jgi:hypothetical protein